MFIPQELQIYVYTEATDMRKSFTGLSGIVHNILGGDIRSGSVYVFFNRRRDMVKVLWYEVTANYSGFSLWMRKLDTGTFRTLCNKEGSSLTLSMPELVVLLEDIVRKKVRKRS